MDYSEFDKFIIEDDGVGLDDPQVLFEKGTSGWGRGSIKPNPFGEGFFSTLMVANKIKIRSIGFEAIFDIRKMFEQTLWIVSPQKVVQDVGL